ncbi:MAG: trigger factor family protein [Saprospiraceae bacterium]
MQVSLQNTSPNQGNLVIALNQSDIKPEFQKELEKIRKNAKIKGFRPGAVPISMIQKLYGDGIKAEILNKLINKAVSDYQQENKLSFLGDLLPKNDSISEPDIESEKFEFSYEVGIAPILNLDSFIANTHLTNYLINCSEENIDAELEAFLNHFSDYKQVEEAIIPNDLVELKVKELESGEEKLDGIQSEFSVLIDDNVKDEIKSKLLSSNFGDKFNINIHQVENNQDDKTTRKYFLKLEDSDIRQYNDEFSAEIIKISRKVKGVPGEELYKKAFGPETEVNSEESLRSQLRKDIGEFYKIEADRFMDVELSKKISSFDELKYPDAFLKNWLSSAFEEWKAKSSADFDHDLIHFKEGLNWQLFKKTILEKVELKVELEDIKHLIVSKYQAQIPGLNFTDEQWSQVAMNVLKDKEKAQEFYTQAQNSKMLFWLKEQVNKVETAINLDDFREKVKELNKHEHHDHSHDHHDHEHHEGEDHEHHSH